MNSFRALRFMDESRYNCFTNRLMNPVRALRFMDESRYNCSNIKRMNPVRALTGVIEILYCEFPKNLLEKLKTINEKALTG